MKTRSALFDEAWANRRGRKSIYQITYKRRYWNGAAYVLEATAQTITKKEIKGISGISQRFGDNYAKNKIATSNVTIVLKNKHQKWLPSNTASGVWRKNATATVGHEPIGSEFTIKYGYILSDDTEEYLTMFVGRIDDDPLFDSKSGTVSIPLVGLAESKLEAGDAQNVGTTLTDQATDPATGDGSNATFSLNATSIWSATSIRVAAVAKTLSTNYTLDKLNEGDIEGDIVFAAGSIPTAGQAVLYNAKQWYEDQKISTLVGYLCDEADIASADREIEEPNWPSAAQSVRYGTPAEWTSATKVGTNSDLHSGYVQIGTNINDNGFEFGAFAPDWASSATAGGSGGSATATIQTTGGHSGSNFARLQIGAPTGPFDWRAVAQLTTSPTAPARAAFRTGNYVDLSFPNASWTQKTMSAALGATDYYLHFIIWDNNRSDQWSIVSSQTAIRGDQEISFYYKFESVFAVDPTRRIDIDTVMARQITGSGTVESAEIDLLSTPTAWTALTYLATLFDGTVSLIETKTSTTSGGAYSSYETVGAGDIPISPLRRYIKVRITFTPATGNIGGPEMDYFDVNFLSANLFIASADFTGMTCLQAIHELARMGSMEYGTKPDGKFFFRNREVGATADIVINQSNAAMNISRYSTGKKEVRNIIQVRYGSPGKRGYYFTEYKASDAGEASPTTAQRLGKKVLSFDLTKFAFSNSADITGSIARKFWEDNYREKRRIQVQARIVPHLDQSDVVAFSFHDSPLIAKNIFGDPFQVASPGGANPKTLARDIIMKVVGHSPDILKKESLIDLEEILS